MVGIPYFFSCHLAYKHQMLFVYEPLYETGGVFFPKIFRRFIFGLIIAQVCARYRRPEREGPGEREREGAERENTLTPHLPSCIPCG